MDYSYDKWNKYKIGEIPWVNKRKNHLCRGEFVEYVLKSKPFKKNILEVGAGEAIEAQMIRKLDEHINYNILDVSDTFLENAKKLGFECFKGEMHNTNFKDKQFDLIYGCSILEHSPDLNKTFSEFQRISKYFYFTMFKWKMRSGGIKSVYHPRKYFTSVFNIDQLLSLLSKYGTIKETFICTEKGKKIDFKTYRKQFKKIDHHRNGNYLSIIGVFK